MAEVCARVMGSVVAGKQSMEMTEPQGPTAFRAKCRSFTPNPGAGAVFFSDFYKTGQSLVTNFPRDSRRSAILAHLALPVQLPSPIRPPATTKYASKPPPRALPGTAPDMARKGPIA